MYWKSLFKFYQFNKNEMRGTNRKEKTNHFPGNAFLPSKI